MKKMKTMQLTTCAVFAALSALLSQISIPIGTVPINFTHVSIFMAAGLLGAKYGTLSQLIFVLLGAVGAPVFSGFTGGLGIVMGPTGGFIIAYVGCAWVTGTGIERFGCTRKTLYASIGAGYFVTYLFGTACYMHVTGTYSVSAAFAACMLPFIPGDLLKAVLATVLVTRLKPILDKAFPLAA